MSYHDRPEVSRSQLVDLLRTPAYFYAANVERSIVREATDAMELGSALHALVLEPETFDAKYVVKTWDARTKDGKAEAAQHAGKTILDAAAAASCHGMAVALHKLPEFAACFDGRVAVEREVFWTDEETGIALRAKPDLVCRVGGALAMVDVKTSTDASPDAFARSAERLHYHLQAAHYLAGWEAATGERCETFAFAVVEKGAPHLAAVYPMDADWIAAGEALRRRLLAQLAECRASGVWPGYSAQVLTRPKWAA